MRKQLSNICPKNGHVCYPSNHISGNASGTNF